MLAERNLVFNEWLVQYITFSKSENKILRGRDTDKYSMLLETLGFNPVWSMVNEKGYDMEFEKLYVSTSLVNDIMINTYLCAKLFWQNLNIFLLK